MIQRFKHGQKRWRRKFACRKRCLHDPLTNETVEVWLSFFWIEEKYVDPVHSTRQVLKQFGKDEEMTMDEFLVSLWGSPVWMETSRWSFKKPQFLKESA